MSDDDLSTPPASADSLEALLARAVAAPALLPPGTRLDGRYEIERVLGAGGMGTVYLARDPKLDRRVAIKLHRAVDPEHLRTEALAMARLAHPNVVTVFEINELDGQPYVVMEYVAGQTLRGWLVGQPRRRGEILRHVHAAGEGLVAAHAAGLVHRDVKPENILVGNDGRARIGDFGLARIGHTAGAIAGTPAYMAPEQRAAGTVDERADQYALAVVAWEALTAKLPPAGELPARLRQVLERARAERPERRWPSVRAFLEALAAAERRPRQLALAALGTIAVAAAVTAWAWPAADPTAACEGLASELDRVLPAHETATLTATIRAAAAPHAAERGRVIERAFVRHRHEHAARTRLACRARVTKQWSPELVSASAECLAFHARTARELARAMATTLAPGTLVDAVQLSARLPAIAACTDARTLAGWRPIVPDAARAEEAITARAQLTVADLQVELGQLASARRLVDGVAAGRAREIPNVALHHELVAGKLELAARDHAAGERQLEAAYFTARARDDGEVLLRAVASLVHATASVRRDREAAARWIANGLADAERAQAHYPSAATFVRVTIAEATAELGDTALALQRLADAEARLDAGGPSLLHATMLRVRATVYGALGRWSEAVPIYDALVLIYQHAFGAHHPLVAQVHADRATALRELGRYDDAKAALDLAMEIANAEVGAEAVSLAAPELSIGATLLALRDERAGAYLDRARARLVTAFGERHPDVALVDSNLALIYLDRGERTRALTTLRRAITAQEARIGPDHPEVAAALYNLAVAERDAGDLAAARTTAHRCAAIIARRQPGSPRHVFALGHIAMIENLAGAPAAARASAEAALAAAGDDHATMGPAWARLELAKALLALDREPARVRRLLAESRAAYQRINLPGRVDEIDALLARLR